MEISTTVPAFHHVWTSLESSGYVLAAILRHMNRPIRKVQGRSTLSYEKTATTFSLPSMLHIYLPPNWSNSL